MDSEGSGIGFNSLFALICIGLIALGLVVLGSAGQGASQGRALALFRGQLVWSFFAILAGYFAWRTPLHKLERWAPWIVAASLLLLVLVLIPGLGYKVNGARRWLKLGPLRFQAAEWAKLGYILGLSCYLSYYRRERKTFWYGFLIPCCYIALPFFLIMLQPDFGTAVLYASVGLTLLFLSGTRLLYLLPCVGLGVSLFGVAVLHNPVRLKRITAFLDWESNRLDGAYQLWQGLIGLGSGGVTGIGLGKGRQQLAFLPEAHNDFILAIIGEELGLIATSLVVLAFLALFLIVCKQLQRAPHCFHYFLALGMTLCIVYQALFNIGVVTGCLPTKGIGLPFISYGGANRLILCVFVGLLLQAFTLWRRTPLRRPLEF